MRGPAPALLLTGLILAAGGCASSRLTRFDAFGRTGEAYTETLDELLTEAGKAFVAADSHKLLSDRELAPSSADVDELERRDEAARGYLEELALARRQVGQLASYFSLLQALATTRAPSALGPELKSIVTALADLTGELGSSELASREKTLREGVPELGTALLADIQLSSLNQEQALRGPLIAEVLRLHVLLLDNLGAQLVHDLGLSGASTYRLDVLDPFADPKGLNTDSKRRSWIKKRQDLLTAAPSLLELNAASSAARKLGLAWQELLGYRLEAAHLETVNDELARVNRSLELARTIDRAGGESR